MAKLDFYLTHFSGQGLVLNSKCCYYLFTFLYLGTIRPPIDNISNKLKKGKQEPKEAVILQNHRVYKLNNPKKHLTMQRNMLKIPKKMNNSKTKINLAFSILKFLKFYGEESDNSPINYNTQSSLKEEVICIHNGSLNNKYKALENLSKIRSIDLQKHLIKRLLKVIMMNKPFKKENTLIRVICKLIEY